jgi:5'-nucleotidase
LARRATFIDSVRTVNPNTLVFDSGNWGDLNASYGKLKSDFILKCMTRFDYDAVCLGDREFFWGAREIEAAVADGPAVLIANVTDTDGKPIGQSSMIKEFDGMKVGVFGVVHDNVLARSGDNADQWVASDVFTKTAETIAGLEKEGAQVIVMLTQVELAIADSLIRSNPSIDVAVLGHRPGLRKTHGTIGDAIVVRTGTRGQNIGVLKLTVDQTGEILEFGGKCHELADPIKKEPEILLMVAETMKETKRLQEEERANRQAKYKDQFEKAKKEKGSTETTTK